MTEQADAEPASTPGRRRTSETIAPEQGALTDSDPATGTIDLLDPQLMRDPARTFSRVRERAPLVRGVMPGVDPMWVATRYEDVRRVLSDPRFVADPAQVPGAEPNHRIEQLWRAR
ncbi:hypothetical protein [Streptomyces anulatus]|uniref:hypothetical protein n=2 Tax=Streptomyces TaxID=1883 RepID=UPI0002F64900|nr:hypothetical protein [Streptomyces anulatus]